MKNLFIILVSGILLQSCSPVFSDLQDASTTGKSRIEIMPSAGNIGVRDQGTRYSIQNNFGMHFSYGITDRIDIRSRVEYITIPDEEDRFIGIGIAPKFSLIKDRIAFSFYTAGIINSENKLLHFQPGFHFTIPVAKDYLNLNLNTKALLFAESMSDPAFAINAGFGISSDFKKWVLRPEYGVLFSLDASDINRQFSLGLSLFFGK